MKMLNVTENNFRNLHLLILFSNIWVVSVLPFIYFSNFDEQKGKDQNNNES